MAFSPSGGVFRDAAGRPAQGKPPEPRTMPVWGVIRRFELPNLPIIWKKPNMPVEGEGAHHGPLRAAYSQTTAN
jgi:hypothetical protein